MLVFTTNLLNFMVVQSTTCCLSRKVKGNQPQINGFLRNILEGKGPQASTKVQRCSWGINEQDLQISLAFESLQYCFGYMKHSTFNNKRYPDCSCIIDDINMHVVLYPMLLFFPQWLASSFPFIFIFPPANGTQQQHQIIM